MLSMSITIELAPEDSLGRRFQYAFLSYALGLISTGGVVWDPLSETAEFSTPKVFVDAVNIARDAIVSFLRLNKKPRGCESVNVPEGIDDCCLIDSGPKSYAAGGVYEGTVFTKAFSTGDNPPLCSVKVPTAKGVTTRSEWVHAAISYATLVIQKGGPLRGGKEFELPWLAKATLFGKARETYSSSKKRVKIDLDTLGTILLGGALSYLGRFRLGQEGVEFYIIPDSPNKEYATLRNVVAAGGLVQGPSSNIAGISAWVANNFAVSLEVAFSLALAVRIFHANITTSALEQKGVELSAKIYNIKPQRRPMVTGSVPLSLNIAKAYDLRTIVGLLSFARRILGNKEALQKGAASVVSNCLNALYLQSLSPCWTSYLTECVRELDSISATLSGAVALDARRLKQEIAKDYEDLTLREC